MKKISKKMLAVLLSVVMLLAIIPFAAFASSGDGDTYPTVYLRGKTSFIVMNKGEANEKYIYTDNVPVPDGYIKEKAKEILPKLALAVATGDYDDYCDSLVSAVSYIYDDMRLDKNGNVTNGSVADWTWSEETLNDEKYSDGTYNIHSYTFQYDWRLDPCETADTLNEYINDVLKVTGKDKINLVGRCLGSNIVMAYLAEYGGDKLNSCMFICPTMMGDDVAGEVFSGKLNFNPDAIDRYASDEIKSDDTGEGLFGNDITVQLVKSSVSLLTKAGGLNIPTQALEKLYAKISEKAISKIVMASYGSFPSFWSMIGDEDFEDAKNYCFGENRGEYSEFIKKIDNYHYNVQQKAYDILKELQSQGVYIYNISKYGSQTVPVIENYKATGDDQLDLKHSSFGATSSDVDGVLSDEYIENAKKNGTEKYISPDKQVDASTCLFPDTTWIIKNIGHTEFPGVFEDIAADIIKGEDITVDSDPSLPQYMVFNKTERTFSPMTAENCDTTSEKWSPDLKTSIFRMVIAVLIYIFHYLSTHFGTTTTAATA